MNGRGLYRQSCAYLRPSMFFAAHEIWITIHSDSGLLLNLTKNILKNKWRQFLQFVLSAKFGRAIAALWVPKRRMLNLCAIVMPPLQEEKKIWSPSIQFAALTQYSGIRKSAWQTDRFCTISQLRFFKSRYAKSIDFGSQLFCRHNFAGHGQCAKSQSDGLTRPYMSLNKRHEAGLRNPHAINPKKQPPNNCMRSATSDTTQGARLDW